MRWVRRAAATVRESAAPLEPAAQRVDPSARRTLRVQCLTPGTRKEKLPRSVSTISQPILLACSLWASRAFWSRDFESTVVEEMKSSERYFFGSGGKCANIFCTPLSRFLVFLSELLESVSLEEPRQIKFFVLASNRSTTRVPTL